MIKRATISLTKKVRCKRIQLPLTPACAMTIHKSQGGTFDSAVILYDKSQKNSLVYVALSQVKSIDGLYLINASNDFKFYLKSGSDCPSTREIRDEYARLNDKRLKTITNEFDTEFFKECAQNPLVQVICTINAQSLVAHKDDIASDKVITRSNILVITETWMDPDQPVSIQGYELIAADRLARESLEPDGQMSRRTAGGVAIYLNVGCPVTCQKIVPGLSCDKLSQNRAVGELSIVEMKLDADRKFILVAPPTSKLV